MKKSILDSERGLSYGERGCLLQTSSNSYPGHSSTALLGSTRHAFHPSMTTDNSSPTTSSNLDLTAISKQQVGVEVIASWL